MSWEQALFWILLALFGVPFVVGIAGLLLDAAIARAWRLLGRLR